MSCYVNIKVENKIARLIDDIIIVCGNSDYIIKFDFDEEWNEHTVKTARFITALGYQDVVFEGDSVNIPVLKNTAFVRIGVFAGDLRTTTPAEIFCKRSILCEDGPPVAPGEAVYNKIVILCENALSAAKGVEERANDGEFNGDDGKSVHFFDSDGAELPVGESATLPWGDSDLPADFASYKAGDLIVTDMGYLIKITELTDTAITISILANLKGEKGEDGSVLPSITDNGTAATPHLDINFGKPNEVRKAFFEQSLLLGTTHYGDGFMQDKNGNRMLMPTLSQNETMATERKLEAVKKETNTKFGYYGKTGSDKHEIKCNGLYIIFGSNSDLKLCKSDGTEIVSGAQQIMFMTTPYNGVKSGSVFVAMGMYIYKGTLSIVNLKIPVEGLQAELDDGSYITAGSTSTNIYISEMVKDK